MCCNSNTSESGRLLLHYTTKLFLKLVYVFACQMLDGGADRDDGVRPSCRFCGKTFAQASYIKAHERLHTGMSANERNDRSIAYWYAGKLT